MPQTGAVSGLSAARFAGVTTASGTSLDPDEDVAKEQSQFVWPWHWRGQISQVVFQYRHILLLSSDVLIIALPSATKQEYNIVVVACLVYWRGCKLWA